MKFYTIGYGNRVHNVFFEIIKNAGIKTVLDIREKASGWSPFYRLTKKYDTGIVGKLAEINVDYIWLPDFGNPFRNNKNWRSDYANLLDLKWDKHVSKLVATKHPACLMCGCLRVENCHREIIAQKLKVLGHEIRHL